MIAQTVIDPKADKNEPGHQADNQTTRYIYAAELNAAANAAGSPVPRADLLRAVLYPDSSLSAADVIAILNGDPGAPANYDFVEYVYHANGATAAMADQRGVNHDYLYDALGRLTEDRASPLGDPNVDGAVRAIVTTYNQRGLAAAVTSYNDPAARDAANVVNQVAYAYNGLNLVTQAWQSHAGPVNRPADAGPDSPSVHYAYDPLGRLTAVTYPNGRVVGYEYGAAGSMDDRLARVAVISDGTGPNAPHLAEYDYLGASTIVRETFPQPAVRLNYADANGAVNRLDRFGRAVDQVWEHYDELGVTDAIRDFFAYDSLTPGAKRIPARSPLPVSVVALAT
jgi:YD repeat-containing protein